MEFAEYHPPLCHFLHPKRCSIWVSSQNLCTPAASRSSAWSGEAVSWEDGFATLLKSVNVQVSCLNSCLMCLKLYWKKKWQNYMRFLPVVLWTFWSEDWEHCPKTPLGSFRGHPINNAPLWSYHSFQITKSRSKWKQILHQPVLKFSWTWDLPGYPYDLQYVKCVCIHVHPVVLEFGSILA